MIGRRGSSVPCRLRIAGLLSLLGIWSASAAPSAQVPVDSPQPLPALPRVSRDWKQLQSPHFLVSGNSSGGVLSDTAVHLEIFRDTVSRLFPAVREASPHPTRVVVFRNDGAFHEFKPRDPRGRVMDTVAGYLTTHADANYIVLAARPDSAQTARVVLHEFAHYLIHGAAPRVPRWLDEGLADLYSTIQIDEDGRVQFGQPIRGHLARMRRGLILPVDRLLSARGETTIFGDMREQLTFYAQSWALAHYLTLGHGGKREGQLEAYLQAIAVGAPLADASHALGRDLRPLHLELATYVRRSILPTRFLTRPPLDRGQGLNRPVAMLEAAVTALRTDLGSRVPVFSDGSEASGRASLEPGAYR